MLLVIDSGNTNVVFAVYDGETQLGRWRAASEARRTADEYAVWLTQLMALKGLKPEQITGSILASVVPTTNFDLKTLCRRYFGSEPLIVGEAGVDLGIEINIDRPEQAGADRLVNTIAGFQSYGGPLIVVDFGTGANFDVVGPEGSNEGCIIAPGINLSVEALYQASAMLPRIAIERPSRVIGKATIPAMQSGIYWGYVSMIEGLVARIKEEFGQPMTVVATGGLAPLFARDTSCIDHVDLDLTLRGLVHVYHANQVT